MPASQAGPPAFSSVHKGPTGSQARPPEVDPRRQVYLAEIQGQGDPPAHSTIQRPSGPLARGSRPLSSTGGGRHRLLPKPASTSPVGPGRWQRAAGRTALPARNPKERPPPQEPSPARDSRGPSGDGERGLLASARSRGVRPSIVGPGQRQKSMPHHRGARSPQARALCLTQAACRTALTRSPPVRSSVRRAHRSRASASPRGPRSRYRPQSRLLFKRH
ncbi:hypothetical protein NDU88_005908 [Pleurodeles waltl]|uniref:Uncharacterized protein n=1 Tax=Pleurodeles waltl TaxID=8319 RepID=A0AAV7SN81_PLEWA|nr:hypothetical protein NDU88_005908 [Pleurodeles waltl]